MKTKHSFRIFLLLLCIISLEGCNDDDQTAITLEYEDPHIIFNNEGRSMTLTPFSGETIALYIKGGDGNYTVVNSNKEVVQVNFDGEKITFNPLRLGTVSIKIEDKSNNIYILTITVKYWEETNAVYQKKYIIQGDNITVGDKTKLEKEIEVSNIEKGYNFVYKEPEEAGGTIRIYYQNGQSKETDFKKEHIILDEESAITIIENTKLYDYWRVTVKDDNSVFYITRNFFQLIEQQHLRANFTPAPTYCYIKDVTKKYITKYPAVEHVYIIYEVVGKKNTGV
ncbi:hypothetical protein [Bacteroides sp.]|uniref:hypothetical protein n=1 Tax=Bacteroides sp. TaxID=29523 RepID=UPI002620FD90|nr:hypothetical protein [Bacteroides sp.]MDD3039119.1 hypothetical protein [Bacteroides sp.]